MLEVPAWLIELAARDDPPTTIGPDLVARLQTAGVEALEPAGGLKGLREDEAGQADGIGAVVPGVSVVSSFEPGRAPVAAALADLVVHLERFDRLRRLRLAAIDMDLVEGTARALRDRTGPARLFERVLESGLLTVYGRPYLGSNRTGGVANIKGRWEPTGDDAELHRRLIDDLRGGYHAHAERSRYRTLTDTAALLDLEGPVGCVNSVMADLQGNPARPADGVSPRIAEVGRDGRSTTERPLAAGRRLTRWTGGPSSSTARQDLVGCQNSVRVARNQDLQAERRF